ncbi:MAG TPA: MFS transporter [Thermoanaerobaculia bacterium]|nr:MFS transporter [Thermoanaerobaculia bacterium]HQN06935.1 MFS transporter [Thermoanaerobaculia bacterium]HQP84676.1 MFS transporter [Thermoanaerobaculia bacterium]
MARLRALLARAVDLREGEGPALGLASAYFFLLLASYYVIRPLRDEFGVRGSESALSWLFVGTLLGTAALNPLFSELVTRLTRKVFVPVVYRVLLGTLVLFWALLSFAPEGWRLPVAQAFFIWASVFNLFAVSVFWGFLADLFRPEQGKRLFGFIAVGGTLGAVAGAALTASLAGPLGPTNLILLAAVLLEGAVFCVRGLVRHFHVDDSTRAAAPGAEPEGVPPGSGALSGLATVSRSTYLLAISLFLLFFTVSSTFLYFEQARIVKATFTDSAARTAWFARIDLWVNLLSAFTQLFLAGRVVRLLGVGGTLVALPVLTLAGFAALAVSPTAGILALVMVTRRAGNFALFRPAREVLFTVLPREEKYAAKSFVDTFVYRFGDVVGAFADKGLRALGAVGATLAGLFLPVAILWALLSAWLGRRQGKLAAARESGGTPADIIAA